MPDLRDGEINTMQGSASRPYVLRNVAGVYSCSCPAWRNQSLPIDRRTCKHLRRLRGDEAEAARIGGPLTPSMNLAKSPVEPPPLLLAETWSENIDPTGWWQSEKLDGVRAYWNGSRFLSRQGHVFRAPAWFTTGLPETPLDGELWMGRRQFQRTVSIVRRQDPGEGWKDVHFLVFDAPGVPGEFEQRLAHVQRLLARHSQPIIRPHSHVRCTGREHLLDCLGRIASLGGEGVMLRRPGSLYEPSRSSTLLKVKRFQDAEAVVVGHEPGRGRHRGRLGALLVEMANGVRFAVGTGLSDAERTQPPAIGSTIAFRYQELTDAGVPRFPSYIGLRHDRTVIPTSSLNGGLYMATASSSRARRFEFVGGTSSKFWEIQVQGKDVVVRFGRIGTAGQTQTKSFPDAAQADRHAEKLIREKRGKGYIEAA
jgi:DNA ligase-1